MRILTIIGARPQFIKAAAVSRVIRSHNDIKEIIVHTGQHFDANMSDVFFEQMDIPRPNHYLKIANLSHGAMTGRMIEGIEELIQQEKPDWVLVYGDTNSTLAGALAAAKLHLPIAHVEAGLRSHNPAMPEEINRVLTDRVSSLLLCPTETAVNNLEKEGFPYKAITKLRQQIVNVGDVMFDAVLYYRERALKEVNLETFGLEHQSYALCTIHRQENTDQVERIKSILSALQSIAKDLVVVLTLHPRTKAKISQYNLESFLKGLYLLDPLPYLEMQRLQMSAKVILTDSGGMQKEAYFHRVPCITLRDETEWIETVETGWNQLVGVDENAIVRTAKSAEPTTTTQTSIFGDGYAVEKVIKAIAD
ncbi:MAG: non-hydrolyzing UDP-N-acetylglucosamine 2-epimerase [bacterium]